MSMKLINNGIFLSSELPLYVLKKNMYATQSYQRDQYHPQIISLLVQNNANIYLEFDTSQAFLKLLIDGHTHSDNPRTTLHLQKKSSYDSEIKFCENCVSDSIPVRHVKCYHKQLYLVTVGNIVAERNNATKWKKLDKHLYISIVFF
jgi:hypothetical protein